MQAGLRRATSAMAQALELALVDGLRRRILALITRAAGEDRATPTATGAPIRTPVVARDGAETQRPEWPTKPARARGRGHRRHSSAQ